VFIDYQKTHYCTPKPQTMHETFTIFSRPVAMEKLSTLIQHNYRVLRPSYIMDLSGKDYLNCRRKGYLWKAFDPPESIPWI